MTESNDKDLKKVHLIKQPRQDSPEQPQEMSAQNPLDQGAEKKKVVVVVKKKTITTKKVQAKAMIPGTPKDQKIDEEQSALSTQPHSEVGQNKAQIAKEDQVASPSPITPSTTTLPSSKSPSNVPSMKLSEHKQEIGQDETIISSQRRYSSDGRAGNLAQGRPSSTFRNSHDRGSSRPANGSYQGRAYGHPSGRSYPSSSSRSGQSGSQQFSRGNRPSGGFQSQGGTGSGGRTAYPYAKTGQPGSGQRPGGYIGARQGPAGGRYGLRQTPAPVPSTGNERPASRRAPVKKKGVFNKREEETELEKQIQLKKKAEAKLAAVPKSIDIMENISISELAKKMNLKPADLISKLMSLGVMATINQKIDADTAAILAAEYSCEVKVVSLYDETVIEKAVDRPEELRPRPPIVTVMGHVDHGKTKLLDAIRKTDVVSQEFGGITQHIGAYMAEYPNGKISFLDTPGHAAFTKMRARGANITDIVVLVVSATEGVMMQTKEAIDHAKAANVPIIVAINKIDLPEANPDRVKTQLSELGLIPEEWGGQTQFVEVSALQKIGIRELFDAILLQAEMLDLKANYDRLAEGKIIESRIDQGRGIVATLMVQNGTLHVGDPFVAGIFPGRVRAMFDDKGNRIEQATPSMPVEVIGFEGMPEAGDPFEVVEDEKFARQISTKRQELKKYEEGRNVKKVTLDNLYETISQGEIKELKVIIKGDVHGSVEALKGMLEKLSTKEVHLNVIRAAAGAITEDDVMMASASNAIIVGFNVRPTSNAKQLAEREKVDIRKYNLIYRAQEEIKRAMEGLLAPELKEQEVGKAEVRNIFRVPKAGIVAGCFVSEGIAKRNCQVRVIRDNIEIFQGNLSSLKRFKDDVKEVAAGYECGIGIENCNDLKEGDVLEFYETIEVARTLESGDKNEPGAQTSS
ncbi:MAG: translation initiation factor IF-2 [Rectinema sp.]